MMYFLPGIVVLLFVYYAQAQTGCAMITQEDLSGGLLVKTYNSNLNPKNPIIVVEDFSVVCVAAASKRDTYRYISVVVRQICLQSLCPEDQRDRSSLVQYDFQCDSNDKWSTTVLGNNEIRDDNPTADLETDLRTNCSVCSRTFDGVDSVTHCRPCLSDCNEGAKRCNGFTSGCCTYYSNDVCVSHCPLDTDVADSDFNCVTPEECPELESPGNGTVDVDKHLYPGVANYSCDDGYELDGEGIRQCQIDGTWEGEPPSCVEIPTEEPTTDPTTEEPSVEAAATDSSSGISRAELGIVIGVVVVLFVIIAGVFLLMVALWACKN